MSRVAEFVRLAQAGDAQMTGVAVPMPASGRWQTVPIFKAVGLHQSACVLFPLPPAIAGRVLEAGRQIPASDLAGDGQEQQVHVTVKYGFQDAAVDAVRQVVAGVGPIQCKLDVTTVFPPSKSSDGAAVVVIDVHSPGLRRLHEQLLAVAGAQPDTFPYQPHVTLAYVRPEVADQYADGDQLQGVEFTIDQVQFVTTTGQVTEIWFDGGTDVEVGKLIGLLKDYNPDEPRDAYGRWVAGGAELNAKGKPEAGGRWRTAPVPRAKLDRPAREALANLYLPVVEAYGETREVDPATLRVRQNTVNIDRVGEYIANPHREGDRVEGRPTNYVLVAKVGDQNILIDGNHRTTAALLADRHLTARVVDMDRAMAEARAWQSQPDNAGYGIGYAVMHVANQKLGKVEKTTHPALYRGRRLRFSHADVSRQSPEVQEATRRLEQKFELELREAGRAVSLTFHRHQQLAPGIGPGLQRTAHRSPRTTTTDTAHQYSYTHNEPDTKGKEKTVQGGVGGWRPDLGKDYNPDEPRDDHGQWTAGGGGAGASAASATLLTNPAGPAVRAEAVRQGFDPAKVQVDWTTRKFEVGGQQFEEGAHANLQTGEIVVRPATMTQEALPGVMAHEIMHQKFHQVFNGYLEEQGRLHDWAQHDHAQFDAYTRPNGELNTDLEETKAQFPISTYLDKPLGQWDRDLQKADGCTPYSTAYWEAWKKGEVTTPQAYHETLAEMARLDKEHTGTAGRAGWAGDIDGRWRYLYNWTNALAKERYGFKRASGELRKSTPAPVQVDGAGTVISYLDQEWRPVPASQATTVKVRYPDGRVVFGTRVPAPVVKGYNPDEPRDETGKWTSGGTEPVKGLQVYHGGTYHRGESAFYWTANREMANSYVDMYNDRFGGGGRVLDAKIDIDHPAPPDVVEWEAKQVGIDNTNYTPASVFDSNLHGQDQVDRLVRRLKRQGYDGAVLDDIAYGKQIQDKAYILFSRKVGKLHKAGPDLDPDELDQLVALAYDSIDWAGMVPEAEAILDQIARAGALSQLAELGITTPDLIARANAAAQMYAQDRAAELVGMRRQPDGTLVQNPDAQWAISDSTRDDLRDLLEQAFADETPMEQLTADVEDAGAFQPWRATMIARTEAAKALVGGNLGVWRELDVPQVEVILSMDHDQDDECNEAAENGPYPIDQAPDVPIHPNCECSLQAYLGAEEAA